MRLNDFFTPETARRAGYIEKNGGANPFVTALEYDSRKIREGSLYFALPGLHADGHAFIEDALAKGAKVIVHQKKLNRADFSGVSEDTVFIRTEDARFAMSPMAASYHGFPAKKLILAGVTGTEGKSTTVYLIWQLLRLAGKKAGFISTVQYSAGGEALWNPEHQTTPEATIIHLHLAEMLKNGAEYAVIEASSHGLSRRTNRLGDVIFDAAVMTNVTHEHLEFHGTWEQYRDDKANLFRSLDSRAAERTGQAAANPLPFGVINADDKSAVYFASVTNQKTLMFSTGLPDSTADLRLKSIDYSAGGNRYEVSAREKTFMVEDQLPGAFNAGNVLAALLVVSGLLDKPAEELAPLVSSLVPVRGRMTPVIRGQPFEVLVDYAHTPSSFQTIFPPLRARLDQSGGRIISLFGSAGERDTKKRSEQGAIAARYSDVVILADEDPRGEEPAAILEEIAAGCGNASNSSAGRGMRRGETLFLIPDRPAAIRKAFSMARPGDLTILLGKGHENSIIYKDHTMKYDEIAEAEKALDELIALTKFNSD
ncbi:MAG: UDP-N-acetylmuramoyl-L-alanyl-D-glutamate--2,6-diaminopimelate ligase [Treponema sp.]|jgi:UDP-N-acetylmuramoyl-L-alanyl-D-glutamate--2,6-diaminopimelate ligase|nr:UDP-N-acetylmuramoyl-L-alanyl-D-glutamate--2,6-diaminopimelate ligase [Treponema sp.]